MAPIDVHLVTITCSFPLLWLLFRSTVLCVFRFFYIKTFFTVFQHTSSETDTSMLIPTGTSVGTSNGEHSQPDKKTYDSSAATASITHKSSGVSAKMATKSDDRFSAQHRLCGPLRPARLTTSKPISSSFAGVRCSTLRPEHMAAYCWISSEVGETAQSCCDGESAHNADPWEAQFERHLKRFSLPVAYRPTRLSTGMSHLVTACTQTSHQCSKLSH